MGMVRAETCQRGSGGLRIHRLLVREEGQGDHSADSGVCLDSLDHLEKEPELQEDREAGRGPLAALRPHLLPLALARPVGLLPWGPV